jgi:hypothetical protein
MVFMNPEMLVLWWMKLLPYLEDDLHCFHKKGISRSEILYVVSAVRSCENIRKETSTNGCRMMHVK